MSFHLPGAGTVYPPKNVLGIIKLPTSPANLTCTPPINPRYPQFINVKEALKLIGGQYSVQYFNIFFLLNKVSSVIKL